jgi:hypothetical protein
MLENDENDENNENNTININIDKSEKEKNKNDDENKQLLSEHNIYNQNEYYEDLKQNNNNPTNNNNDIKEYNLKYSFDFDLSRYKSTKIFGIPFYHIGKIYVFGFFNKNSETIFCIDKTWYFHLLIYFIELILLFAGNYYVFNHLEMWKRIIYNILILTFFISYSLLILINPGIVTKSQKGCENNNVVVCKRCNICYLPEDKISHCIFCDICVKNLDHHCDVVRRCITEKNYNYFLSMIVNFVLLYAFAFVNITYYCIDYYKKITNKK